MTDLSQDTVRQIIEEINGQSELTRRALAKRRHDIYKDGGKHYLIEQIKREFDFAECIRAVYLRENDAKSVVPERISGNQYCIVRCMEQDGIGIMARCGVDLPASSGVQKPFPGLQALIGMEAWALLAGVPVAQRAFIPLRRGNELSWRNVDGAAVVLLQQGVAAAVV